MKITVDKAFDHIKRDARILSYYTKKMNNGLFDHGFTHRLNMVREHLLDIEQLLIELTENEDAGV